MTVALDVVQVTAELRDVVRQVELRLRLAGYPEADVVAGSLRDVLVDLQGVSKGLALLEATEDPGTLRVQLRALAAGYVNDVAPHTTQHFLDVIAALDAGHAPGRAPRRRLAAPAPSSGAVASEPAPARRCRRRRSRRGPRALRRPAAAASTIGTCATGPPHARPRQRASVWRRRPLRRGGASHRRRL